MHTLSYIQIPFTPSMVLSLQIAGVDETLKLFAYADLQLRYAFIRLQMKWMGWKLKRQLVKDTTDFEKFLKEYDK